MDKNIAFLIRKFLTGKTAFAENTALGDWFRQNTLPRHGITLWSRIRRRMWKHIELQIAPREDLVSGGAGWLLFSVAASILILISLGIYFYNSDKKGGIFHREPAYITVAADTGQVKKVKFIDGTIVWLNSCSSISYTNDYGTKKREVKLVGEAFFDVAHDNTRPFIVNTRYTTTHVLGTSFQVRAYSNETQSIEVTRGKVKVEMKALPGSQAYFLFPGEVVTYDPRNQRTEKSRTDLSLAGGWRSNLLHFDAQPLSEVAATLERRYGVTIRFSNVDLATRKFSGTFDNQGLKSILNSLRLSMELNIKYENQSVIEIIGKE